MLVVNTAFVVVCLLVGGSAKLAANAPTGRVDGDYTYTVERTSLLQSVTAVEPAAPAEPTYGLPVRLIVPKLGVDKEILSLGPTREGDMEVPDKIEDLGWYNGGPNPGMEGSAVIVGHLGVGKPGIFVNLHKLQPGDTFSVIDDANLTVNFVVRETKLYDPKDRPWEVFFSKSGSHLNLITCAGKWDRTNRGMDKRLVVFSDRI